MTRSSLLVRPWCGVMLLVAAPCLAQDVARVDQVVQSYATSKQFMGSVLVARGGDVIFSKGYGAANLEWDIPNSPATKFRIGSVTKQFTAACILLLEERGKVKIDEPVKTYLPDAPAAWDKITIFHLLTHTSGIPSFTSFPEYASWKLSTTSAEAEVARFRDKPLEFQPGERWNYSNSGYVLLGYLIEKISGTTYESFLRENVFAPLGMNDSGYDYNAVVIPRRAAGYSPGPRGVVNAGFVHMSVPHAAGALYSTTEDLLRWERGLFEGKLLSETSLRKMMTPFKSNYAFGVSVRVVNGRKIVQHSGGIEGFNSSLTYYPDTKVTVVVLGNLNGQAPDQIGAQLAALAHGESVLLPTERKEVPVDPKLFDGYVGRYQLAPNFVLTITRESGHLFAQATGQPRFELFAEGDTDYFLKAVDAQVTFETDAQGKATALVLHQNGGNPRAPRIE